MSNVATHFVVKEDVPKIGVCKEWGWGVVVVVVSCSQITLHQICVKICTQCTAEGSGAGRPQTLSNVFFFKKKKKGYTTAK